MGPSVALLARLCGLGHTSGMQIERNELRVLSAIVEEEGFGRAAERLNLSQSAVSQTMANLEHRLGTQFADTRPQTAFDGSRKTALPVCADNAE